MISVIDQMKAILEDEDHVEHIGMPRRSGRYPWGSGEDPYQHNSDFLSRIDKLKKDGWSETPENIEKEFHMTTGQYRIQKAWARDERDMLRIAKAKSMRDDGMGATEIGKYFGVTESTVRGWFDSQRQFKMLEAKNTAELIKKTLEEKNRHSDKNILVDVGVGVERELGISKEKLNQAVTMLEAEGYLVTTGRIPQATNKGQLTTTKVVGPKGAEKKDFYKFKEGEYNIESLNEYTSHDNGETFDKFVYPKSMNSDRLMVRYKEDGGEQKDGLIELRRGVKDLSLGEDHYAQVRILVDDKKYIKGMAVYSDDMPKGVDVIFNTHYDKSLSKTDVLKDIKSDPENPFGSLIKPQGQSYYEDENGKKQLSLINKRASEGDWGDWKDALPSQFLGKQSLSLAKKQLSLALADKKDEYESIMEINNPVIKKYYLNKFAEDCDSSAVSLSAAALPGQKYHVLIPINSLKDNEIYAPNYENGTKLALIRYPHGGTFEIPVVTVNNKHKGAQEVMGPDWTDAVGINHNVAARLSGADYDGDTVMCIPTHDAKGRVKINSIDPNTSEPFKKLVGFNDLDEYGAHKVTTDENGKKHYYRNGKEYKIMSNTDIQMGVISNLITDMTLLGAPSDELVRAVKHSMVVIDAEKHKLDYRSSEIDNNIAALHKEYQGKSSGGAATLLSRSKGEYDVLKRQGSPYINMKGTKNYDPTRPEGALIYKTSDDLYRPEKTVNKKTGDITLVTTDGKKVTYNKNDVESKNKYYPIKKVDPLTNEIRYTNKDGSIEYRLKAQTQKSTRMMETDDAFTLVSKTGTSMEKAYASYANSLKAMANDARKEYMRTEKMTYSDKAAKAYAKEVKEINEKLNTALLNAPRERQANIKANAEVFSKIKNDPTLTNKDIKKLNQQAVTKYRKEMGSVSRRDRSIVLTDSQWEAIQAGAVRENTLIKILNNSDPAELRQRATPKASKTLSTTKIARIKQMKDSNYTIEEIARKLGISASTVSSYLKG